MNEKSQQLTNRIAVLRAERKMTQKELAEKADVSRQTILSIENKKYSPSLVLAFKIAKALNVDINMVFQYKEESN
ncbi:helix-turn-helix transcriptional regulator [Sporolactobacillus inulinus]|uniref:DNA-binding protein n=1 Tax=Sporolactobacillus inulinus CASD TaxID=1069536 RepID=A0A0U1QQ28_9BACL|nr:helix-turn-helix transcriptional regulator [Sporolactobacillus inulinus]KLI02927.1 DNA-binding protein [Sporolactobacillus inulinus CASD]GEB76622.1 transcriptional regulator [Sporolactobacillus inulinus]